MEWNGGMDWTGMVGWNGGKIEHTHNSRIKSQSYCKPCKQRSGHPSMVVLLPLCDNYIKSCLETILLPLCDNYIKSCLETMFSICLLGQSNYIISFLSTRFYISMWAGGHYLLFIIQ